LTLAPEELPAVHPGHNDIEQNKRGRRTILQVIQGFLTVSRFGNLVAFRDHQCAQRVNHALIVINDQNGGQFPRLAFCL
jgi:hypothetical protein